MNSREFKNLAIISVLALLLTVFSVIADTSSFSIGVNAGLKNSSGVLTLFGEEIVKFKENLSKLSILAYENLQLKRDNEQLKIELDQYNELEEMINVLKEYHGDISLLAKAISPSTTISSGFIYIDKGTANGLSVGDLVVKGRYLIGEVEITSYSYSRVKTVFSVDSKYPVSIGDFLGFARGYANNSIRINDLDQRADINKGDVIKLLPTNESPRLGSYQLGTINQALSQDNNGLLNFEVSYPLSLSDISYVEIIKYEK